MVAIGAPAFLADHPVTAIDYPLARRGPVGTVGLLRQGDSQAPPPAASLPHGYPEVSAGVKLSYPF
jgi:hypothetical protein